MSAMVPTCNNPNTEKQIKAMCVFIPFPRKRNCVLPFPGRTWYSDQAKEQWSRHSLCSPNPRYVVPGKLLRRRRRGRGEPRRESEWEKRRGPKSPVIRSNKALLRSEFSEKKKENTLHFISIVWRSWENSLNILWNKLLQGLVVRVKCAESTQHNKSIQTHAKNPGWPFLIACLLFCR